jgi:GH43 family beta-xylosidase
MKHVIAYVLMLAASLPMQTCTAATLTNPVFQSQDPWVTLVDGIYYYSGSNCGVADICVKTSRSLSGLAKAPWIGVWTHAHDSDPNAHEIWAPELHRVNGRWYIYYAADDGDNNHHRLYVLSSDGRGPGLGTFHEASTGLPHGELNASTNHWGIDPNVFTAADGKLYLAWSCTNFPDSTFPQRICLAPMRDAVTVAGETVYLSTPDQPWEMRDKPIQEGPVGYTRHGRTYITYSGSASWIPNDYAVGLLTLQRGANPLNASAWKKSGPIFDHQGKVYGPGSVVFVPSPDGREYWNVYHAIDRLTCKPAYTCRDIRMQPMHFDAQGAPVLGVPVDPGVPLPLPSGDKAH